MVRNSPQKKRLSFAGYGVIFVIAVLPLFCGYEINIANIPGYRLSAIYSSLAGLFGSMGQNAPLFYGIFFFPVQLAAVFATKWAFERLFAEPFAVWTGVLLYMTCPYRLFVCYTKGDIGACAGWALIPLFLGVSLRWAEEKSRLIWLFAAALSFAGIGYADNLMLVITAGIVFLAIFWYRIWKLLLPLGLGCMLYLPGALPFLRYLLWGQAGNLEMPLKSISENGYSIGYFLTSYVFPYDLPGLGLGLIGALLVFVWLMLLGENSAWKRSYAFIGWMSLLMLLLSLTLFPWDYVQRVAAPFLRLVSLMETQTVFFGFACLGLSMLAVCAITGVRQQKSKFVSVGFPVMIVSAAIGGAFYFSLFLGR